MDYQAHLRETAAHLVWMASMPMAREHAKLREQQLMASDPMYAVLPELIRLEMARRREKSSPASKPA